jgi:hypothetical protein
MADPESIPKHHLRVSSYDRVSSWLVSALIVVGVTVAALVSIYFTRQLLEGHFSVPVTPVSAGGGGGTGGISDPTGTGQDLEPPGTDEAPDLSEPQLQDTLSAVATAVTSRSALIADENIDANMEPVAGTGAGDSRRPGGGGGEGGGFGGGIGSGFGRGRGGPETKREIRFEPQNLNEYAQWLDQYKIELAVLDTQDNKVYYAYNLSRAKPDVRISDPSQQPENRLSFNSTLSQFAALDRQLAAKAGIADKGEIILQFFPDETATLLLDLEQKSAEGRTPEQIRRTIFRVTRNGNRFGFSVEEQSYR